MQRFKKVMAYFKSYLLVMVFFLPAIPLHAQEPVRNMDYFVEEALNLLATAAQRGKRVGVVALGS